MALSAPIARADAAVSGVLVRLGTAHEFEAPASGRYEMKATERFLLHTAGGGGYGDPRARDRAALARDIAEGYVSARAADKDYGAIARCIQPMAERLALGDYDQWHHFKADVQMIRPVVRRGRPRRKHVPDVPSIAAEDMLITAKWQNISWRTGTKGKLKARFAAVRVRVRRRTGTVDQGQEWRWSCRGNYLARV
jgi:hypothetical protein